MTFYKREVGNGGLEFPEVIFPYERLCLGHEDISNLKCIMLRMFVLRDECSLQSRFILRIFSVFNISHLQPVKTGQNLIIP